MPRRQCPPCARLAGAYEPPLLRVGDVAPCLYRGAPVRVARIHDAPIPWPWGVAVGRMGRPGPVVTEELARALRAESSLAVQWHWRVGESMVTRLRRAFGVTRSNNPGTVGLWRGVVEKSAELRRGRPLPEAHLRELRRRYTAGESDAWGRTNCLGPWWSEEQVALVGTLPDEEVALRVGRSVLAVRLMRKRLERRAAGGSGP